MSWVFVCLLQKMQKIHVIKFLPYFPPHRWGLESHVQERSQAWTRKWYGDVINVTTPMGQDNSIPKTTSHHEAIIYQGIYIWYKTDGYQVVVLDAFDLIPVFPFPKFRTSRFWTTISYLNTQIKLYKNENIIINTHTRFFLTTLCGGIFAKLNWLKRIHIEHGTDFVKLANPVKTMIAYMYDQIVGRLVFRTAEMTIGISIGCQKFANIFTKKNIPIIHRGMDFLETKKTISWKKQPNEKTVIWFVGRLVTLKWVDLLIHAFNAVQKKHPNIVLHIVWDGDQLWELQKLAHDVWLNKNVVFLWAKDRSYVANDFLPHVDILVNPSYQEWLPTSVLEWLLSKCVVVATNVWGTPEISTHKDLILVKKWDVADLERGIIYAIQNYPQLKWLSYEYVVQHFDRNKSIAQYHKIYTSIVWNEK